MELETFLGVLVMLFRTVLLVVGALIFIANMAIRQEEDNRIEVSFWASVFLSLFCAFTFGITSVIIFLVCFGGSFAAAYATSGTMDEKSSILKDPQHGSFLISTKESTPTVVEV